MHSVRHPWPTSARWRNQLEASRLSWLPKSLTFERTRRRFMGFCHGSSRELRCMCNGIQRRSTRRVRKASAEPYDPENPHLSHAAYQSRRNAGLDDSRKPSPLDLRDRPQSLTGRRTAVRRQTIPENSHLWEGTNDLHTQVRGFTLGVRYAATHDPLLRTHATVRPRQSSRSRILKRLIGS
ncbi:hypothetical protein LMG27174_03738 [Paraburkholderia rhynchosiae]|uniref:Uncharacterized protein n=1 Tax=Paraburkholderia rhynchosiae TaxID=487049 RepID=A0A6J5BF53_9BURK|nr:hypothetical protein LMG27174_03738 [Paraburkholderia rhynchosiae]